MHNARFTSSGRTGFVLPTVVVAIVLVALLAAGVQSSALRADRQARLGFAGEHALHAADAAIAERVSSWNARDFAAMPVGARDVTTREDTPGLSADVVLVRTNGTNAWIEASVRNARDGNLLAARRRIARFIGVESPPLPLSAALTALGDVRIDDPASFNGGDQPPPGWTTDCEGIESGRDVPALAATSRTGTAPAGVVMLSDSLTPRALFDSRWSEWRSRAAVVDEATALPSAPLTITPDDRTGHCAPATGDPLRDATASPACTHEWGARFVSANGVVTLDGRNRFQGVLLIDGDLVITGDLLVDGLMIVRGALQAAPGRLTVHGAVLVRDETGRGSRVGLASRIQYSRCAMQRALAATGIPSTDAQRSWFERP